MSDIGHNTGHGQLKAFISRIERLEVEGKAIDADKKDVYAEAKATGFDVKIMKKVIAIRRKDPADLQEEEALVETYLNALNASPPPASVSRAPAREAEPETAAESLPVAVSEPIDLDIPPFLDRRPK